MVLAAWWCELLTVCCEVVSCSAIVVFDGGMTSSSYDIHSLIFGIWHLIGGGCDVGCDCRCHRFVGVVVDLE